MPLLPPTPDWDPVAAVLSNRDLVHEILARAGHGGEKAWPARDRAAARTLSPSFADAAGRLPVSLHASDPALWALARHGSTAAVTAALAGLVSVDGSGGGRAGGRALATLLTSRGAGSLPALAALTSLPLLHGPWLREALGEGRALATLSLTGFWHAARCLARLPAGASVSSSLTFTQLPGGGVGRGQGALLPHPRLLAGFASAPRVTLVGLAGAMFGEAGCLPADVEHLALEAVPVLRLESGGGGGGGGGGGEEEVGAGGGGAAPAPRPSIRLSLPPSHPRLASLRMSFAAPEGCGPGGGARGVVVEVAALARVAAAVTLSAPGRAVRLRVPRPPPRGLEGADPAAMAAAALAAVLREGGLSRLDLNAGVGWEVEVGEGRGEGGASVVVVPGPAVVAAAGVGHTTPHGWAWRAA
jgi:hypothetical protein